MWKPPGLLVYTSDWLTLRSHGQLFPSLSIPKNGGEGQAVFTRVAAWRVA